MPPPLILRLEDRSTHLEAYLSLHGRQLLHHTSRTSRWQGKCLVVYIDIRAGSNIYDSIPVEAMSDSRASAQPSREWQPPYSTACIHDETDGCSRLRYRLRIHNMQGTAGLYYVSNPVSCIIGRA